MAAAAMPQRPARSAPQRVKGFLRLPPSATLIVEDL
jgi:hypothetical protein